MYEFVKIKHGNEKYLGYRAALKMANERNTKQAETQGLAAL